MSSPQPYTAAEEAEAIRLYRVAAGPESSEAGRWKPDENSLWLRVARDVLATHDAQQAAFSRLWGAIMGAYGGPTPIGIRAWRPGTTDAEIAFIGDFVRWCAARANEEARKIWLSTFDEEPDDYYARLRRAFAEDEAREAPEPEEAE